MKLVIGIVNWNTKDLLNECLLSVFVQKAAFPFSVAVVDNASTDESVSAIKNFPRVMLIQNKENMDMAAGLNQIITKKSGEYYLFLHPDTKLEEGVLQRMIDYLDAHPTVGVAGCKVTYPDGKPFASCHRFPTMRALSCELIPLPLARALSLHGVYLRGIDYNKEQDVDIIASACLFIRKKCLDDAGLFDVRFTNWMAEWDLCARAKKQKWEIRYVPIAAVVHYEGQMAFTKAALEYKKYAYVITDRMLGSLFLFYEKHYPRQLRLLKGFVLMWLLGKSIRYFPFALFSHNARARIKNYLRAGKKTLQTHFETTECHPPMLGGNGESVAQKPENQVKF